MPFLMPTLLLININDTRGLLHRIKHYSFPEKQTYDWYKSKKVSTDFNQNFTVVCD